MSILVDENTRLLVQGITGKEGRFHAKQSKDYGTNLVAGVTPGRGGVMFDEEVPVFNTVEQAAAETGCNASLIFVPPPFAADAMVEAVDAGVSVIACITEGIPVLDTARVVRYIRDKPVTLIGPNCPGIISPGARCKLGIMPGSIHMSGRIGVVSRSGTLTYETVGQLTGLGIGQSTCVGIGGDPVNGSSFVDILRLFQEDPRYRRRGVNRGDRRHQRTGGRRVHQKRFYQACGGSDCGAERPAGQTHGACWGDHYRQCRPRR